MAVRKDEVQLSISFITDESKRYAKLIQDNKQFISDLISAQKKGEDVADTIKKIVDSGKGVADIDLTKLTPSQLVERARQLDQIMRRIPQNNPQYKELEANLKQINSQLATARAATRGVAAGFEAIPAAGGALTRIFESIAGTFGGLTLDNLVNQIITFGKELFKLAPALDALDNKAKTVFGDTLPQVTASAEQNAKAMGLTTKEYVKSAAAAADLLIPMQFTRQEGADLSLQLVNLSGALAEWEGGQYTAADTSKILTKALLGEREELKSLGISISEEQVQNRLREKGLKGLTGVYGEQAKAIATIELITEKSTDAIDAYAKGTDTLTRRKSELRATLQGVTEEIATGLQPVLAAILNIVTKSVIFFIAFGRALGEIPRFIVENRVQLLALVVALVSFNATTIAATASTLRQAIADKAAAIAKNAQTVATNLLTAAQKGLNFALKNNPIGLVITVIGLLVAAFVTAYQRSESFRASIQGLGNVAFEVFRIIGESVKAFGSGFSKIAKGDFAAGFKDIGDGLVKSNPIGIAFTQGDRLKKAYLAGYEKSKLKDAQKKEAEEAAKAAAAITPAAVRTQSTTDTITTRLLNEGKLDPKELAKQAKEAFEARLKEIQLAAGREEIVVEKQLLDREISESAAGKRMLEIKQQQYQAELAIYKQFGQLQTKDAIELQKDLQEVAATLNPERISIDKIATRQPGAQPKSDTKDTEQRIQEQSLLEEGLLRQKFANQVINELQFEEQLAQLRANQAERKLQALRDAGLQETDTYKKTLDEKIKLDDEYLKQRAVNEEKTLQLRTELENQVLGVSQDAISVGIELLSKDEEARKKHSAAIKAFEIGQVLIDSTKEISGIWRNAQSNPLNALIPGWGTVFAAVQTGISLARSAAAVRKITSVKYAKGGKKGFFGGNTHSQGGTMGYFDDGTVVEVEKDEYFTVLNRRSSEALRGLSAFNQLGGGVPFFRSGGLLKFENGGAFTTANTTPTINLSTGTTNTNSTIDIEPMMAEMRALRMAFISFPRELKAKVVYGEYESVADDISTIRNEASI